MAQKVKKVTLIDHHKTAVDILKELEAKKATPPNCNILPSPLIPKESPFLSVISSLLHSPFDWLIRAVEINLNMDFSGASLAWNYWWKDITVDQHQAQCVISLITAFYSRSLILMLR